MVAILPCNDLDASEAFYARLGFSRTGGDGPSGDPDAGYRILANNNGAQLHLAKAVEHWLIPGRNPFGLYLYAQDVDALAAEFAGEFVGGKGPEIKPWGVYEFVLSDPDQTLVRVGRPAQR
jgi:catechol 2,3-dioxygenase-like lactoylglutathione lyase family enzyme